MEETYQPNSSSPSLSPLEEGKESSRLVVAAVAAVFVGFVNAAFSTFGHILSHCA